MKTEAKLTSKGQITVPKEIRSALGVKAGDKLVFEGKNDKISVRPLRSKGVFEKYRGTIDFGIGQGRKAISDYIRDLRDDE